MMKSKYPITTVANICLKIVGGGTPPTKEKHFWEGEIPWISSADISDLGEISIKKYVTNEAIQKSTSNLVPKGTIIVVTRVGVGKLAIAPVDLCFSQDCQGLILKKDIIDSDYCNISLRNEIHKLARKARGATITGVTKEDLKKINIPLPPISTQIRITDLLSRAEGLVAQRKESIRLLDELVKGTFWEMFGGLKQYKQTKLQDVMLIQSGQVDPRVLPYREMFQVGGANIESNTGILLNLKTAGEQNIISGNYYFTNEHILYSKIRPYLNKVVLPDFEGICSAEIYPILPQKGKITKQFLRYILTSPKFLSYINKQADRTSIPKANRGALERYEFGLPPISLQEKFSNIAEQVESLKKHYTTSLKELEYLFGSLSQRAFRGELDLGTIKIEFTDILNIQDEEDFEVESKEQEILFQSLGEKIVQYQEQMKPIAEHLQHFSKSVSHSARFNDTTLAQISKSLQSFQALPSQIEAAFKPVVEILEQYKKQHKDFAEVLKQMHKKKHTFDEIWNNDFGGENYDYAKEQLYKWLKDGFMQQIFDEDQKKMTFKLRETH